MNLEKLDKYRVSTGIFATKPGENFGLFFVPNAPGKPPLKVICGPMDEEWQHVSISLQKRCPTWDEMCAVKNLFWNEDDTVVQFHPKKSEYVNNCETCLHLWRHKDGHTLPPIALVGIK